jgi:hypothetical protein
MEYILAFGNVAFGNRSFIYLFIDLWGIRGRYTIALGNIYK